MSGQLKQVWLTSLTDVDENGRKALARVEDADLEITERSLAARDFKQDADTTRPVIYAELLKLAPPTVDKKDWAESFFRPADSDTGVSTEEPEPTPEPPT